MDGGDRIAPGAAIESNAGVIRRHQVHQKIIIIFFEFGTKQFGPLSLGTY